MTAAIVDDVATELGRPIDDADEFSQIDWWLTATELIIGARLGDVSLLNQNLLRLVEVYVVAAKVRQGGTMESSITVAVDDGSVTRRYENPVSSEDIRDEWWDLLMGRAPSRGTAKVAWLA
jgi:hypothetical protein